MNGSPTTPTRTFRRRTVVAVAGQRQPPPVPSTCRRPRIIVIRRSRRRRRLCRRPGRKNDGNRYSSTKVWVVRPARNGSDGGWVYRERGQRTILNIESGAWSRTNFVRDSPRRLGTPLEKSNRSVEKSQSASPAECARSALVGVRVYSPQSTKCFPTQNRHPTIRQTTRHESHANRVVVSATSVSPILQTNYYNIWDGPLITTRVNVVFHVYICSIVQPFERVHKVILFLTLVLSVDRYGRFCFCFLFCFLMLRSKPFYYIFVTMKFFFNLSITILQFDFP